MRLLLAWILILLGWEVWREEDPDRMKTAIRWSLILLTIVTFSWFAISVIGFVSWIFTGSKGGYPGFHAGDMAVAYFLGSFILVAITIGLWYAYFKKIDDL